MQVRGRTCGSVGGIGNRITIGAGTKAMLDEDSFEIISTRRLETSSFAI